MGIRDFKIPKMKFKKMKIHTDMLEELNEFDFEAIEKKNIRNRTTPYEDVSDYKTITYAQLGQGVFSLGTALIH